jgi:amino acid permease
MSDFNVPEQLWDLANLVTGFAIVQTLTTTITVAKGELKVLKGQTAHWIALVGTAFFLPFYIAAIVWCGAVGSSLDDAGNSYVWTVVTWGRIIGVLLFTAVALLTIWGHRRDEVEQSKVTTPQK